MAIVERIKTHIPSRTNSYFIDSNVWFWFCGGGSDGIGSRAYQIIAYPKFIETLLDNGVKIYHSSLTFAELSNIIERYEYNKAKSSGMIKSSATIKDFRNIRSNRDLVVAEIRSAWTAVTSVSVCLDFYCDSKFSTEALKVLEASNLDAYDSFYCHAMSSLINPYIVTDDGDFKTAPEIGVLTANSHISP